MEMKTIYDLKLHEELKISPKIWVMRVPGGWIYEHGSAPFRNLFVPYNVEFDPKYLPKPEDYTEDPPEDTLPKEPKYKVGDIVRITNTEGEHGFVVGEKVEITEVYFDGFPKLYSAKLGKREWCVNEDQLEDTLK